MKRILVAFGFLIVGFAFVVSCEHDKKPHEKIKPVDQTTALQSKYARQLTDRKFAVTPDRLARGKYLANGILFCFNCHSKVDSSKPGYPPFPNMLGSGNLWFDKDSLRFGAPNISSDKETGAGNWTDDMFARAIRQGVGHDGRGLGTMPWTGFRNLSDEDLASVVVYIRSLPPISNYVAPRILTKERELRLQNQPRPMSDDPVSTPDTSTLVAKGKYLIKLSDCEGCHTGWYVRNPGYFGGGNLVGLNDTEKVASPNITSDIQTGIGGWDDETFIRVIRTGKSGTLKFAMPWTQFANMNDGDLKAILAALKTTVPVNHRVVNGLKPTLCPVCGQMHGFGDQNKIVNSKPVQGDETLFPNYAGTYVNDSVHDTVLIRFKNKKLWITQGQVENGNLFAIDKIKFSANNLPSPISFIKNASGKVIALTDYDLEPVVYQKIN
ncbi:MAG: hypothetical protein C5B52_18730 [Bacteroidetes bacterium]|nr:MAG: hypothetical protein C5B52_18730 [Bacteroidota bacterium]